MVTFGEAWIGLHVKTDEVQPETDRALHKLGHDSEHALDEVGTEFGDTVGKSMEKELERHGPGFTRAVERGLRRKKIKITETVQFDRDNNVVRRWVKTVTNDIEDAFADAGGPGGPLNNVGKGIADAIGAGFNVSGRSSLIAVLVPLIGAIVTLVAAAIQAVNALVASLTTLPALLTSIGLQVGVLMLAFKGVGTAISGAFAAKNAKELQEAIKGLTPPAQEFVKALLPLKRLFQDLKMVAQANFFKFFGADVIPRIFKSLGPSLISGFAMLARVLGEMFRDIALFFASTDFRKFINDVIPSTVRFLQMFGPSFLTFIKGLVALADRAIPMLDALGRMFSGTLFSLGVFFENLSKDPNTTKWLREMTTSLGDVLELLGSFLQFVGAFAAAINDTGAGTAALRALADAFAQLAFFFSTPVGKKAIEGIIDAAIFLTYVFVGLIETIAAGFSALELFGEFIKNYVLNVEKVVLGVIVILTALGAGLFLFFKYIGAGLIDFFHLLGAVLMGQIKVALALLEGLYRFFKGLGERVKKTLQDGFAAVGHWLYDQGRRLVNGFIEGVESMFGALIGVGSKLGNLIARFLPGSPAKEGPLSGQGYVLYRGQRMVQDLAKGIEMEAPKLQAASSNAVSNIIFGTNSINVGFTGVVPTQQQAMSTGAAVGAGINSQLAARNARLAVRTL